MPSSTSSFDAPADRPVPAQPWRSIALAALALLLVLLGAWEWAMRGLQLRPGDLSDDASAWAEQRRRVSRDPGQIVIIGDSRILFGSDLDRFAELTGTRPIQLALTGTGSLPVLQDLASHSEFRGLLIIGVSELMYFGSAHAAADAALERFASETPAQRSGFLLHRALEGQLAFLDDNYRLSRLLLRLDRGWRSGARGPYQDVWKIAVGGADRQTWLWPRIEIDSGLRRHAIAAWTYDPVPPYSDDGLRTTLAATREAVLAIRARGGEVVFLRPPSAPQFRLGEESHLPRARGWDALLTWADARGAHFEDYAAMQGLKTPEYSHLSRACARVYTDAYVRALTALTARLQLRPDAPPALKADDC